MTELLYASTAPVFLIDGDRKGELARDLVRLDVEETIAGLKTLQAHFDAIGPAPGTHERLQYLDGSILDFGRSLEVSLGPPNLERVVFTGLISGIEAEFGERSFPRVTIFAEDRLMDLRMTRRMRTYENMSDAEIAAAIASEHGMTPDTDADGPTYDVVQQWNQSDLAFLRDRARLVQAEVWFTDNTLHFKTRPNRGATALTLVQGNHLVAVQLRADLAHQRSRVTVSGYDAKARGPIEEEAGDDVVRAEVSGGRTGPSVLGQAFGERVSHLVRETPLEDGEARAWARAEMLRRSRSFLTVVGTTRGSPDMVVGSVLTLERVGAPFEGGGYYVTRVHHVYDQSGHRTRFEAERATLSTGGS